MLIFNILKVKVFAMEDTPINFSTATSMSDLVFDDLLNSGCESGDFPEMCKKTEKSR